MSQKNAKQKTGIQNISWADDETLRVVRPEIRKLLEASPAFAQLLPEEKKELASKMVKIAAYMGNPDGLAAKELSDDGGILARAQKDEDPVEATKRRLSQAPGFAGKDFEAGAVKAGVEQFGQLVQKVDFPEFVSGLIKGVFKAIVDSSIEQMRAYGELLANVAKTVDQFARDNITENNARDWLSNKFPDELGVVTPDEMSFGFSEEGEQPESEPHLEARGDDPEAAVKRISEELGMAKPVTDISDPNEEQRLVLAARLQMARSRQQLLASMVILGINRIVVTDGYIRAKVVFDMRAADIARRRATASMHDMRKESHRIKTHLGYKSWLSPVSASIDTEHAMEHVATVGSAVDETSESKAEVKAKLSGDVNVNFKSDYFPMEKMANPEMIAAIQGNAKPLEKPVSEA